ncbi:aminotransferase class V-fold PLP-dependent enzyme [Rasiella rasia]|uniref:Aminotransferase class V-fold PLP-dependent enzyme n=1 Tax=Rasiella rasia TaxID=2744027 RepID=A0A6G6GPP4_9FLAO|nr:pyridoxal-dependent decarboxylase [Rasiella rasia]QIE60440.1 aminotransferase class V-fold PLP-dependent enzyme [Rasiella rasia]
MQHELALFNKLANKLFEAEKNNPVAQPLPAEELFKQLDLSLSNNPATDFEETLEKLVLNTPRTSTRLFFNQLFGGRNPKATLGDLLAVLLNNSMYTYKVAGPQVGIEKEILKQICTRIGYPETSDGTFAPGGSMSNFMAMVMARDAFKDTIKNEGITQKLTLYTSKESHYSIPKNAALMGVGREQVRYIETDEFGKMNPHVLVQRIEKDLENGLHPFFVNATAGTTVLGAFDPIEPLSEICQNYGLWLHVDGAYCGSVIFSDQYQHLVNGLARTDSFSVNAHKMMGTPLTCSIIVTRHKQYLHNSFSNDAAYLYQTNDDDYNLGKTSLQCGRRNDALKFWTLWKSVGTNGLAALVHTQFELADAARAYVEQHPDYTNYSIENSISVCFNYKNIAPQELCTALYEHAELMVGYGTFRENEFVRLVTINAGNSIEDIITFFTVLERFVEENEMIFNDTVVTSEQDRL